MSRTITLRLFGLAVAAALTTAAIALLTYGLGGQDATLNSWMLDVSASIAQSPQEGQQALVGAFLLVLAGLALFLVVRKARTSLKRLERNPDGTTSLDMATLAWVVQRRLRDEVDSGITVRNNGSRQLKAVVPVYTKDQTLEAVDEAAALMPQILADLGAPRKHMVVTGRPARSRVR